VKILRNAGYSPFVQTNWTSPARVQSAKSKNGKEVAVVKSLKNTTQLQRRRHVGSLKNNYVLLISEMF
jgi:hypothetical protein